METIEIISTVVAATATILAGVWFIIRKAQQRAVNDYRIDNMESHADSIDNELKQISKILPKHEKAIQDIETQAKETDKAVAGINKKTESIQLELAGMEVFLGEKFPGYANTFSVKKSPRTLNENGQKIFNLIKGKDFLNDNKDFFFSQIDAYKPATPLDVEMKANLVCLSNSNSPIYNDLKRFIYNEPAMKIKDEDGHEKDYELTLRDACFILSLPLRDMYLKAHPEIQ